MPLPSTDVGNGDGNANKTCVPRKLSPAEVKVRRREGVKVLSASQLNVLTQLVLSLPAKPKQLSVGQQDCMNSASSTTLGQEQKLPLHHPHRSHVSRYERRRRRQYGGLTTLHEQSQTSQTSQRAMGSQTGYGMMQDGR